MEIVFLFLVYPWDRNNEGTLVIYCAFEEADFKWRLINGLDLGKPDQGYVITKISIQYCPMPSQNDVRKILKNIN